MKRKPSIVVIGAGVAGLSAALRAAELGVEVTVVERNHIASGSTALSAGVFSINQVDQVTLELRIRAREMIDLFERENDMHVARIGYLRLARTDAQLELFQEAVEIQEHLGVEPSEVISRNQLKKLIPDLRTDDLVGGMFNPRDGHIDGPLVCGILSERAQGLGAVISTRTAVETIDRAGKKHYAVGTTNGTIPADVIINAAGPWAMQVGELLEAPVPLVNQRHEVVRVKLPEAVNYVVPMVQEYVPGGEEGCYFRQDGPDTMLAGFHSHDVLDRLAGEDPDSYLKTVSPEVVEEVAIRVSERLQVEGLGFKEGWCGLYPMSADGEYIVGPHESEPNIFTVAGLGGAGLASGLSLGRAAAEWAILEEPKSLPSLATAFLPERPSLVREPSMNSAMTDSKEQS